MQTADYIYADLSYLSEIRQAAIEHDFEEVRQMTGLSIYFKEEVDGMTTEEIHSAWLESGDDELEALGEMDSDCWNALESERRQEDKDLHNLESERQDI